MPPDCFGVWRLLPAVDPVGLTTGSRYWSVMQVSAACVLLCLGWSTTPDQPLLMEMGLSCQSVLLLPGVFLSSWCAAGVRVSHWCCVGVCGSRWYVSAVRVSHCYATGVRGSC